MIRNVLERLNCKTWEIDIVIPVNAMYFISSAVECPEQSWNIVYGYSIGSKHTYGVSITHRCNIGFIFPHRTQQIISVCTELGTWSAMPPDCQGLCISLCGNVLIFT